MPLSCICYLCIEFNSPHRITERFVFFVLLSNINLSSFSLKPLPLILLLHTHVKSPSPAFLQASFRYWKATITSPCTLLQAEQHQLFQPELTAEVLQPSDHFCGLPLDLLQQVHVFPVLRAPELDAGLQVESHQSRVTAQ